MRVGGYVVVGGVCDGGWVCGSGRVCEGEEEVHMGREVCL